MNKKQNRTLQKGKKVNTKWMKRVHFYKVKHTHKIEDQIYFSQDGLKTHTYAQKMKMMAKMNAIKFQTVQKQFGSLPMALMRSFASHHSKIITF